MEIKTERLLVRSLQAADAEPLADLWADPEVMRYMGGPRDRDEIVRLLEEDAAAGQDEFDLWSVLEQETGELVGHCGILEKEVDGHEEHELVYVLRSVSWGRGYATEAARAIRNYAFEEMGLARLISLIDPENADSERVAVKVGMRLEKEVVRPGGAVKRVYAVEAER